MVEMRCQDDPRQLQKLLIKLSKKEMRKIRRKIKEEEKEKEMEYDFWEDYDWNCECFNQGIEMDTKYEKYGLPINDKRLRKYLDEYLDEYIERGEDFEYGNEIRNEDYREDENGTYLFVGEEGEVISRFDEDRYEGYILKEYVERKPKKIMSLEETAKRKIIENTWDIKKMLLLTPTIYNDFRKFYILSEGIVL